jgi:hypothetical protein
MINYFKSNSLLSYISESKQDPLELQDANSPNIPLYGVSILQFFYLVASLTTLIVVIYNHIKEMHTPIKTAVSYFSHSEIKEKQAVESVLENFIKLTGCHRVCIGLFHNGSGAGSIHFKKMSVTHEAKKPGISSFISRFRNIDLYKVEPELLLSNSYEFISISVNDSSLDSGCKNYMISNGLKYILCRQLLCKKGIYGIIELHFVEEPDLTLLNNPDIIHQINIVYEQVANMTDYIRRNKPLPIKNP